jgi:hypothetical protein
MTVAMAMSMAILFLIMSTIAKSLEHSNLVTKGRYLANDAATVLKVWEDTMNYLCVAGSIPVSMELADMALPTDYSRENYSSFSFTYTPPPTLMAELRVASSSKVISALEHRIESAIANQHIQGSTTFSRVGNVATITAFRDSDTSRLVHDNVLGNSNAIGTTINMYGTGTYNGSGCN